MEIPIPPPLTDQEPEVFLARLEDIITPSKARDAIRNRFAIGLPSAQIKSSIRKAAITILKHEQLSPVHQRRLSNGTNTFVFFLCAAYGVEAPGKDSELSPAHLSESNMLPLRYWDSVYLALVAEVRDLYNDLEDNLQQRFEGGKLVLHMRGPDGTTDQEPFTAADLATQLEEMWLLLMDTRLLGPIENAVRMENAADYYRKRFGERGIRTRSPVEFMSLNPSMQDAAADDAEGIPNLHKLTYEDIIEMLWEKYAPVISRACREYLNVDIDLAARREQLRKLASGIKPAGEEPFCSCDKDCNCRMACQFEVGVCACKSRVMQPPSMITGLQNLRPSTQRSATSQSQRLNVSERQNKRFEAPTNEMAGMQITSTLFHPGHEISERPDVAGEYPRGHRRRRAGTENSELAYVQSVPKAPVRGVKETIPLGFYESEQRYPRFESRAPQAPDYDSSHYTTDPPARKPVPQPSSTPGSSPPPGLARSTSSQYPSTIESSSPEPEQPPPTKRWHWKPKGKGKAATSQEEPQRPEDEFRYWNTENVATPRITPMHPQDQAEQLRRSPMGRHSADSPPRPPRIPASMMRSNTAESAFQPLPNFIAPAIATKQRYVSAGGDAKLHEREEIQGFALPPAVDPGMNMSKEEIMARTESRDIITPIRAAPSSIPRSSQEGGPTSGRTSQETSDDSGRGEKRDRASSNTSAKPIFKRLFSRSESSLK